MLFESLESRQLMSVSLNVATGLLAVQGTAGSDTIVVSKVNSQIKVQDNAVTKFFNAAQVKNINVLAGAGADTVKIDATVFLPTYINTGTGGASQGDSVQGGSGKDVIDVYSDSSGVNAGAGNDTINNFGGFNSLNGGANNDVLVAKKGGATDSTYDGGTGVDTIDFSAATVGLVLRNGQSGIYFSNTGIPPIVDGSNSDNLANFENFTGGKGNDYIFGNGAANTLIGNGGNDYLRGFGGNDTLNGGAGADAMYGDDGDDLFYANDGIKDFLAGGVGNDKAKKDAIDVLNGVEGVL
jgi:Ca2+-binding RTX toxin-like protein